MASKYASHLSAKQTPQSEPVPGKNQVQNNAGGYVFALDDWKRLERFLILGSEGGTYYATERKLTLENADCVRRCVAADAKRTVDTIAAISDAGRAPKNDPAIVALAVASHAASKEDKEYVYNALPKVCRIGTHLFQFAALKKQLGGWGMGLRKAIERWYVDKKPEDMAFQMLKYQNRDGWSHRDLLRLCHIKTSGVRNDVFRWAVKGWSELPDKKDMDDALMRIWCFEKLKREPDKKKAIKYIGKYGLQREMLPTQLLNEPEVWEAMLEDMPLTAMIRNLATMTRIGLLAPLNNATAQVIAKLEDAKALKKARIHPVGVLAALLTYKQGRGERGSNTWTPVPSIVDALDDTFYRAFDHVEPTGKRWYLGCDVSGSMYSGSIAGIPNLTPGMGAAAMAMVTARVEKQHHMAAFNTGMVDFDVSKKDRLDTVAKKMAALPWGGTDCSMPMIDATERKIPVDCFVVYTDNETWAGRMHPFQALQQYRQKMGINAKLAVVGMTSTGFTIASPDDAGMIDFVGFDAAAPQVMADFARE